MAARDPRTGRFVSTANTPEATEGKFATYADLPAAIQGDDPADLAYDTVPRHGPAADDLAQGGSRFPLRARHPVLISADEEARTRYGAQGALTRDAARLHGLPPALGHVLGVDDSTGPANGVDR